MLVITVKREAYQEKQITPNENNPRAIALNEPEKDAIARREESCLRNDNHSSDAGNWMRNGEVRANANEVLFKELAD